MKPQRKLSFILQIVALIRYATLKRDIDPCNGCSNIKRCYLVIAVVHETLSHDECDWSDPYFFTYGVAQLSLLREALSSFRSQENWSLT